MWRGYERPGYRCGLGFNFGWARAEVLLVAKGAFRLMQSCEANTFSTGTSRHPRPCDSALAASRFSFLFSLFIVVPSVEFNH
jgi:hypothetical protein